MYIVFMTLWFVNGVILYQPYKKAVDACLWASRQESNYSTVLAIGFKVYPKPIMNVTRIDCKDPEEIDRTIKFGRGL